MDRKIDRVTGLFRKPERYIGRGVHVGFRAYLAREMAGDGKQVRILDIGCGNGEISLQFLPMASHITLLDNSPEMLDLCRANVPVGDTAKVNYVCSDFHAIEPDILFDLVLCIGVLAHVDSVESTFTKLSSFLAPGGVCLVQLTDAHTVFGRGIYLYENWIHQKWAGYTLNRLSARDTMKIAGKNGLYLIEQRTYWTVLPGFGWLPDNWIWRFQESTLRNSWLARWGTEVFLMFQKNNERK